MRCPTLAELPPPPPDRTGWPWTEETPPLPDTMPDGSPWPRISIVTPSYNQRHFLEETIRSVLLQGYPNLVYILIDGGSTDGSIEVIEKYEPWLAYWVSESDRGQSYAINKGFERCSGDLITYQNSDDFYLPGTFQDVALNWSEHTDVGAVIGGFYFMDANSKFVSDCIPPKISHPGPIDLSLGPPGIYRLHQVSTFFTQLALDTVGRWMKEDLQYVLDRELLYRVCRKYPILLIDRPFGVFRRHDESKSVSQILPFAREFSKLYLLNLTGEPADDRRRKRMARYHLARGHLKYAKAVKKRPAAVIALLRAGILMPRYFVTCEYFRKWIEIVGA